MYKDTLSSKKHIRGPLYRHKHGSELAWTVKSQSSYELTFFPLTLHLSLLSCGLFSHKMLRLKSDTSVSPPRNIRQRSAVCARPLFLLFSRVSGEICQCIVVSAPATLPLTPASHPQLFNFEVHTKVAAPPRAAAADEVTASRLLRFAFRNLAIAERRGERDLRLYLWEWAPYGQGCRSNSTNLCAARLSRDWYSVVFDKSSRVDLSNMCFIQSGYCVSSIGDMLYPKHND